MSKTKKQSFNPALFQKVLLKWFDRSQRDLPWRKTRDPYAIFLSEMMLQQTQVKTVIPYYERFLKELPDWNSLADAGEDQVLKLWEGLGYYRRARNLKAAAQQVVKDFKGKLPDKLEEIKKLPGVGPYSAGAILSIAFQKPIPLVDGNVERVFSRLFMLKGDLKTGKGHEKVWKLAQSLVPSKRPGDFNQALMELGATTCLSENPLCLLCPLMPQCLGAQKGLQNKFPETPKPVQTVEVLMAAVLIIKGRPFGSPLGRSKTSRPSTRLGPMASLGPWQPAKTEKVLVRKRSEKEKWLKGLWEFPSTEGSTFEEALRKLERKLKVKAWRKELKEVKHQITNHKICLKLYPATRDLQSRVKIAGADSKKSVRAVAPKAKGLPASFKWVDRKNLSALPFSSAQDKLRKFVQR